MKRFTSFLVWIISCGCLGTLTAQNVGLNINPPEFLLDVRGLTSDTGAVINLGSQDNGHFLRFFSGRNGDPNPFIWWRQGEPLRFAVGDGMGTFLERMRIRSGGTIGINNSNPQYPLQVNEPAGTSFTNGTPVILGEYTGTNLQDVVGIKGYSRPSDFYGVGGLFEGGWRGVEGKVIPTGTSSYFGVYGDVSGGSGTNFGIYGSASGSGTNWAGYFANGNVFIQNRLGIGQAVPLWTLDISALQAVTRMITTSSTNGSVLELKSNVESPANLGAINFNNSINTYPGQIAYSGNNRMGFRVNGTERMVIDENGNVNIGISGLLGVRLNVDGGVGRFLDGIVAFDDNMGTENIAVYGSATGASVNNWAGYFPNGNIYLANELRIGTTVPATGYKVSINGKVMCEELKVQLQENWPDYVFDKHYVLVSLSDLEKEIYRVGHLPGVPSSDELENNGLEVGEMQRVMMEKIEELTLYVISLQKQIDALQDRIHNQQTTTKP